MPSKRKDSKGRILRNGEVQRRDGMYMFRYTDPDGKRKAVYSWKLVSTDKVPEGKKCVMALRDIERQIQRDLEDGIRAGEANTITVNALFKSFMDLRTDLKETTRCITFAYTTSRFGMNLADVKFGVSSFLTFRDCICIWSKILASRQVRFKVSIPYCTKCLRAL